MAATFSQPCGYLLSDQQSSLQPQIRAIRLPLLRLPGISPQEKFQLSCGRKGMSAASRFVPLLRRDEEILGRLHLECLSWSQPFMLAAMLIDDNVLLGKRPGRRLSIGQVVRF